MHKLLLASACVLAGACSTPASAPVSALRAPMALATAAGPGASVGEILVKPASGGVALELHLHGLPPGAHGFHAHTTGSCDPAANASGQMTAAGAAGGHFDPANTGHHLGPAGEGHLGDLPVLDVDASGAATQTLIAPRFHSPEELRGHALIIHAGGDNYSDTPPLGGGGARLACGVVQ